MRAAVRKISQFMRHRRVKIRALIKRHMKNENKIIKI